MTDCNCHRPNGPLPSVLLVDVDAHSERFDALTNAGFVVHRTDDVRAVKTLNLCYKADVVVHMATHFAPSIKSAFETTLGHVDCPVIVVDSDEERGLDLVMAGAADLVLVDMAGIYLSQLIQRTRVAVARQGWHLAGGDLPEHIAKFIENMPYGVLLAEHDGRIVTANRAAEQAAGIPYGDARPWFANLQLSGELMTRMQTSGALDLAGAVFCFGAQSHLWSRVELHAKRLGGIGSGDDRWLVVMRDLEPEELAVRRHLESERARRLVEHSGDMLLLHDTEGRIVDVNHQATVQTGYTRDELLNLRIWDLDQEARPGGGIWAKLAAGGAITVEGNIRRKDATQFPVEVRLGAWEERGDKQIVAWLRNITERRQAEERIRQTNAQLKQMVHRLEEHNRQMALLNSMGDMLQTCRAVDETHAVVRDSFSRLFPGLSGSLALLDAASGLFRIEAGWGADAGEEGWEYDGDTCWGRLRQGIHQKNCAGSDANCSHLCKKDRAADGSYDCVALTSQGVVHGVLRLHKGSLEPADGMSDDINNRRQLIHSAAEHISLSIENLKLQENLRQQSVRDALTGLFNRRHMEDYLHREIARSERMDTPCCILMLDVDHFKKFNDNYGHQAGDALLKALGQFLQQHVRKEDSACRYGGEEFILILPGADLAGAAKKAEQIRADVESTLRVPFEGRTLPQVTISLGLAAFPLHGHDGNSVVKAADVALYQSKKAGRNRITVSNGALEKD